MSSDRELTRVVRSWLEEGANVLPDRVLDDVLAQLPVTSQRRPPWRAWRSHIMSGTFKLAAAVLGVLVVAALAAALYYGPPPGPGGSPTQRPSPSASQMASPTAAASLPTAAPTPSPFVLPNRPMPGPTFSPAGEYGWDASIATPRAGAHWFARDGGTEYEIGDLLFEVGPDCIAALEYDDVTAVSVGGYEGHYVEPYEPPRSYNGLTGDEVTRAYKIYVDGTQLCIYVSWHETTRPIQIQSLLDVIDSMRIQPLGDDGTGGAPRIRLVFTLEEGWDVG